MAQLCVQLAAELGMMACALLLACLRVRPGRMLRPCVNEKRSTSPSTAAGALRAHTELREHTKSGALTCFNRLGMAG